MPRSFRFGQGSRRMKLTVLINREVTCMSWFKGSLQESMATEVAISCTQQTRERIWLRLRQEVVMKMLMTEYGGAEESTQ